MKIILDNIGKRYNKEWILRSINYTFEGNGKYAILGANGSGKSTLLQIIAGFISQSEGNVVYADNTNKSIKNLFRKLAFVAPYLELPEEMTWEECVAFHGKFKIFMPGLNEQNVISISGLQDSVNKELRNFSSGMKQRAKIAIAILSDTPILLLDEPTTNLDESAIKWYHKLISEYAKNKLVLVCSNYNKEEYRYCDKELHLKRISLLFSSIRKTYNNV
jgi:ABC-type multidrug transport system ATPase subunit